MATTNYNLPTISGASPVAIVDDYNALANATDAALAGAISGEKTRAMAAETELANGVSNALTTANTANVSATDAKSAAQTAQTTADNAGKLAATANDTANTAKYAAATAQTSADSVAATLSNLLNFSPIKTVDVSSGGVRVKITVATNVSNSLYKVYGFLRLVSGALALTQIPGKSGVYGYKIDIDGALKLSTGAYDVTAGGFRVFTNNDYIMYVTNAQPSVFSIGSDGNIYLLNESTANYATLTFATYPACLYVNAPFGDSPINA